MIRITTAGETFTVDDADRIGRPAIGMAPSDTWRLTGAVEYRYVFGRYACVRRYTVDDIRKGRVPWFHTNGKQR